VYGLPRVSACGAGTARAAPGPCSRGRRPAGSADLRHAGDACHCSRGSAVGHGAGRAASVRARRCRCGRDRPAVPVPPAGPRPRRAPWRG